MVSLLHTGLGIVTKMTSNSCRKAFTSLPLQTQSFTAHWGSKETKEASFPLAETERSLSDVALVIIPPLIWRLWCLIRLDPVPQPDLPGAVLSGGCLFSIICNFVSYERCKQLLAEASCWNESTVW